MVEAVRQNAPVPVQKLTSTDAFVIRDVVRADGAPTLSIGVVRCAPKILQDGAGWLARSVTYTCASFSIEASGASAGINAPPDVRAGALAAFDNEMSPSVSDGTLVLDAAKGVSATDLPGMSAADPRSPDVRDVGPHALAAGIVAASAVALGDTSGRRLDGMTVAIEGIDAMGSANALGLLGLIASSGGTVVAFSTAKGATIVPDGIDPDGLRSGIEAGDLTSLLGDEPLAANRLLGADASLLLVGAKAGALEHNGAAYVRARAVVPWGPVAVTAKALAVLTRSGVVVVPDFLALAGPLLSWTGPNPTAGNLDGLRELVAGSLVDVFDHDRGAVLGACLRAEAFLGTWVTDLPFGRPLG